MTQSISTFRASRTGFRRLKRMIRLIVITCRLSQTCRIGLFGESSTLLRRVAELHIQFNRIPRPPALSSMSLAPDLTASLTAEVAGIPSAADCQEIWDRTERQLDLIDAACQIVDGHKSSTIRLSLIVPVYNEIDSIKTILNRIDEVMPQGTETIIVDDASTDGTSQWLANLPERSNRKILRRRRNHGKGSAVRLAIRHTRGDIVAIQDADLEYDPIHLLDVIQPIDILIQKHSF